LIYIVTVNYNSWQDTKELLNSLLVNSYTDFRIIVIDNCSSNNSIIELKDWLNKNLLNSNKTDFLTLDEFDAINYNNILPKVLLVNSNNNKGFAGGNNLGLHIIEKNKQKNDLVWLLNNDTIINAFTIKNILLFVKNIKQDKFAISTKVLLKNTIGGIDSEGWGYLNLLTGKVRHARCYKFFNLKYLVGSSIIMNEILYMDDNFFLYFEDADYSIELQKKGFVLVYCESAEIYHKFNATAKKVTNLKQLKLDSLLYFYYKRFPFLFPIIILERFLTYLLLFKWKNLIFLIKSLKKIYA
jgi:GT2 family glycosyltransferase